jgi:hypothetical protein
MRLLGFLAGGLFCAALAAQGQTRMTIQELRTRLETVRAATDFRATGRLIRVAASGERRSYRVSLRARWFERGLKTFCAVTDPPADRVRLLLEVPASGPASIREGHAGGRGPLTLPFERWGNPLLGTAFAYEDLLENQFQWRSQEVTGEVSYGARLCYLVKSVPDAEDHSEYAMVASWLDHESLYPVHVEKTVRSSRAIKEFVYYGLRQSKGIWSASQVEVKMRGRPGSSLLIIARGAEKANVPAGEFEPGLLTKP